MTNPIAHAVPLPAPPTAPTAPTSLFARSTDTVTLADGQRVVLQALSSKEYEDARREAIVDDELVGYLWDAHLIDAALVEPRPASFDEIVGMEYARTKELALEVLYVSKLAERPETKDDSASDSTQGVDPLVEEFPAAADDTQSSGDGADVSGEGVRVLEP